MGEASCSVKSLIYTANLQGSFSVSDMLRKFSGNALLLLSEPICINVQVKCGPQYSSGNFCPTPLSLETA